MADILDFIKKTKDKKSESEIKQLIKVPKKESGVDMPHIYNNILSNKVFYEADLLYLPTDKFGYKYALVMVDVYDSKCDAVPLKKKSSQSIEKGFKKMFERGILKKPLKIQFDQGGEFKGETKEYFDDEKVIVKYTETNRHRQNAGIEGKNKTIGRILSAYQNDKEMIKKKQVKGWVEQLPFLITYLNEHLPKRSKKYLSDDILATKYSKDLIPLHTQVRIALNYPINAYNSKKMGDYKFRVGDIRYNKEPRKIAQLILNPNMPVMYLVNKKGTNNTPDYKTAYTSQQLQIIN